MIDQTIAKIEEMFRVPGHVADQIKIVAEKVGNSYVLYESRPVWDDNAKPWTKSATAKMTFIKRLSLWKLYWGRASGKWELYGEYRYLTGALNAIKKNPGGCFWG